MKRKTFSVIRTMLLTVLLICLGAGLQVSAATSGLFTYETNGSGVKITKYNGLDTTVTFPSKIGDKAVNAIGSNVMKYPTNAKKVIIPDTVTTIDAEAFRGNTALQEVQLGKGVTTLGAKAFSKCTNLDTLNYPAKLRTLGEYAFYDTNFLYITIPGTVETIGAHAFEESELYYVEIKNGTVNIGTNAFKNCKNLSEISIPQSVRSIGTNTVTGCHKDLKIYFYDNSEAAKHFMNSGLDTNTMPSKHATSIKMNDATVTLYVGMTKELGYTVNPTDCTDAILWLSSAPEKVTVDNYGKINAKAAGTVSVQAKASYGKTNYEKKDSTTVVVKPAPTSISVVEKGKTAATSAHIAKVGGTITLQVTLNSSSAGAPVSFSSSNTKVATVNASGVITGIAEGAATITAKTYNGLTATYVVYVDKTRTPIPNWNENSVTILTGKTYKFKTTKGLTFQSLTPSIASVSKTGTVKGKKAGNAVIRIYNATNAAVCNVTVVKKPAKAKITSVTTKSGKSTIKWTKQTGVTGYQVIRKINGGKYHQLIDIQKASTVSYTAPKMEKKGTYYYKVRAYTICNKKKYFGLYSAVKKVSNK